jgi:formylglycine-generating enzyme required for sulfatase activity
VSLSKPGYRRATRVIEIPAGDSDSLDLTLKAELGEIQLRVQPAGARVQVNGRNVATGSTTLSLPAHEHSLVINLDGYEGYRQRFTPRPGVAQVINVNLQTVAEARRARLTPTVATSLGQTLLLFEPDGTFTMGASRREPGRRANEVLHPVNLSRMFYLMTTEVTNEQFRQFQADHTSGQAQGNSLNREGQPVVNISWQQAAQFCNWLSEKEGLPPFYRQSEGIVVGFNPGAIGYRLPTEAEWAWAARVDGDTLRKFTWGEEFPPKKVMENYADASSAYVTGRYLQGYKDGHVTTAPAGSFDANHKGLFDMGGNVSEWVHDVYTVHTASERPLVDPLGQPSGDNYVIRGANWGHSRVSELRLTFRDYGQAGRDDVGFRIARFAE